MSCNGCRVLRKGCNEKCILRESLRGIESPQAQGNAMLFVAKFFGRAGLVSFLSAVPDSQRPGNEP
ncbi:LOB domain-containing protein [Actinidia chinensis var. chinensis]|uniref:LOB domain-containing protein n=1 Tax=Actinidia chinensis var. chinensis TaxID=1590841 RepID=A0A2R6RC79_ACTCC|nr:LOB domain-containing protein [Actinidia chinensis var. chinensis]